LSRTYWQGVHLIDTSAVFRASRLPVLAARFDELAERYLAATCAVIDLELGWMTRSDAECAALLTERARLLVDIPLDEAVCARAREVMVGMARTGQYRAAGANDRLIAAAAEVHGVTLLHYDHDFDHIARYTGQPTEWVAPPGSIP
jgi:predicted nucleic acid-binding protein